jgi:hypothetical protein
MSDETPTIAGDDPDPMPGPAPLDTAPAEPEPVRMGGIGVRDVALGAIAFVAVLALLLGATRLIERGGAPGPSSSNAAASGPFTSSPPIVSASPAPIESPTPSPTASPNASASAVPTGSVAATPSASPAADPVLVGAGDIATCASTNDDDTAALLDGIEGTVFTAGDNAYESGTAEQFRECYDPNWGRHRDRTRPAPGNHDWETAGLAGYLDYFGEAGQGSNGTSWYSYDLGAWHVIVLDSMCEKVGGCDASSPQGRWLAADLAASGATCTVAIFHHPRFSSGQHGNLPAMDAFWRPLYAAGVDVIVNGHDHDYERFAPQDPDGQADQTRGIREFVVGTGGAPLRNFAGIAPNSEARLAGGYGVLKLTLHDTAYDAEFIAAGSDFRDRGTEDCH